MLDTNILVKLDQFDGPLALLLHLIEREEMDIRKLDIVKVTEQYLDYLNKMRELDFDVAGDFLFLAATLLFLKSQNSISNDEFNKIKQELGGSDLDITSQDELIRRLEELQRAQRLSQKLWALPRKGQEIFVKPKINRQELVNSILMPMDLEKLTMSMIEFIQKEKRKYTVVKRDRLSIKEKLQYLKEFLQVGDKRTFNELLHDAEGDAELSRTDVIITFISLLELSRLKRVAIFQNEENREIYVEVLKSLQDFNVEQANGFDAEAENNNTKLESLDAVAETEVSVPVVSEEIEANEILH